MMYPIPSSVNQTPLQPQIPRQEALSRKNCLCALVEKIYLATISFFTYIFCCASRNNTRPLTSNDIDPNRRLGNVVNLQSPALGTPSSAGAITTILPQLVTTEPRLAIQGIAQRYDSYLSQPVEPVLQMAPGYAVFKSLSMLTRLVRLYTMDGAFRPVNEDMRNGDISPELAQCWAPMGAFVQPGNESRKVYIAHLQQAIMNSEQRMQPAMRTVTRAAWCSTELAQYCLQKIEANEDLFLVNKSILSTSSSWAFRFDPAKAALRPPQSANDPIQQPTNHITLRMSITLESQTPIIAVNTLGYAAGQQEENEIILSAGRVLKVTSCEMINDKEYRLSLAEVDPNDLPANSAICTNIL